MLIVGVVFAIVFLFACTGCKTVKVVTEYRDREVVKVELQHDSIYMHDSIYIASRNDTVFRDRWHTEYAYKYITRVDSFVQIDSIPYPVEITTVVTKNSGFAKFCISFFAIIIAISAAWFGWKIYRKFFLHI